MSNAAAAAAAAEAAAAVAEYTHKPPAEEVSSETLGLNSQSQQSVVPDEQDHLPNQQPQFEIDWTGELAAQNPRNWSVWYKGFVLLTISWTTLLSVVAATAYTSAIGSLEKQFDKSNEVIVTLGLTTYLLGWIVGSLVFAPLSESYGRRWIYISTNFMFVVLLVPTNLAGNLAGIIVSRFFCAIFSAGAIALSPGTISDIANDEQRALAYSVWSVGPFIAPAIGPIFGGFTVEYLGWRWIVWIVMCASSLSMTGLLLIKESYSPVLLRRHARAARVKTGDDRWWSRYDEFDDVATKLRNSLQKPFVLALTEPMLLCWNIYIGLIYGILYLSFTAYPVIFGGMRGWSDGSTGLSFMGLGVGSAITIASEPLIRRLVQWQQCRSKNNGIDPETGRPAPEAGVTVVCASALLLPAGQFWFAWTAAPPAHWALPIAAGVPFGMGATANFIYAINYLAASYGRHSASVMAGNTFCRCLLGATLPLAGPALIRRLGPQWSGSLLAFLLTAMAPIPFVFRRYGRAIRRKSAVITSARREEARLRG